MKKRSIFFIICILSILSFSAYSDQREVTLLIDQIQVVTNNPAIEENQEIFIPMIDTFKYLGAQVYQDSVITSYYLNTFVKIDLENNYYAINGKKYDLDASKAYRNGVLYVPLEVLQKAFDLTMDSQVDDQLYLKANTVIQYRNYDAIQYKQISFEEEGVRFSVPLDWAQLGEHTYGYDSSYGRISVNYSSRMLNDNINTDLVVKTYQEHLLLEYLDRVTSIENKQQIYNYLTSNVLYIELDVNDILMKRVVHFVESEDQVHVIEFIYPDAISESYLGTAIKNIMDSFYIDSISFDDNSEHYIETTSARDTNLTLSSQIYSNMTLEDFFILEGYFDSPQEIQSLTITVTRKDDQLEFYVPVENNSFYAEIHTPFGLGKHNVQVAITQQEEKVTFDPNTQLTKHAEKDRNLLWFSVVNLSQESNRYTIPTKMVESNHKLLFEMSDLIAYKYHTNYSKAKAIYDFVHDEVDLLAINETNYSALDVYNNFEGTKKEIAFYLTALLRAQKIPSRIVEGSSDFSHHLWVEAYLNGSWLILDPIGDLTYMEILTPESLENLEPRFNGKKYVYNARYHTQNILNY